MGGEVSHPNQQQQKHSDELRFLIKKAGGSSTSEELKALLQEVGKKCPWYPKGGSLNLKDWERIGKTLHSEPRALACYLNTWSQCHSAIERISPICKLSTELPTNYTEVYLCLLKPMVALTPSSTLKDPPDKEPDGDSMVTLTPSATFKDPSGKKHEGDPGPVPETGNLVQKVLEEEPKKGNVEKMSELTELLALYPDQQDDQGIRMLLTPGLYVVSPNTDTLRTNSSKKQTVHTTSSATTQSAKMDLVLQEKVHFQFPGEIKVVPSQMSGPLPENHVGLILPRSPSAKKRLFIVPDVKDSDYEGILSHRLPQESIPTQLILVPYLLLAGGAERERGDAKVWIASGS